MRGYYISGTDTQVGKTAVAAGLTKLLGARYWKPVQTGTLEDDDTRTVAQLTALDETRFVEPVYRFRAPLSPHLAAAQEGATIELAKLVRRARELGEEALIVEGAGGLLVPLAPGLLQIDFIKQLELPVLLVVADRLGAINHTLLSLEACRARKIEVSGIILNLAEPGFEGNRETFEEYAAGVPILGRFFRSSPAHLIAELARIKLPL